MALPRIRRFSKGVSQFLRRHAYTLAFAAVCLAICSWMISEGTGAFVVHRGFDAFYDGQADSLAHGHWDVSPDAVLGEAFVFRGKFYGYFGFTPALERIVLNWEFPAAYGHWTRLTMLFWIVLAMAAIVAFMDEFQVRSSPYLLVVAVLGSTLFFLCSHAIVYHEAIMTGAGLALWAYFFFCRYLRRPGFGFLAVACLFSFLAFFTRVSVGMGPPLLASFLLLALLARRFSLGRAFLDWLDFPLPDAAGKHAAFLALCLGITGATYLSINHAKFNNWLNPTPIEYHVQYNAERLARIGGTLNHLSNIPFSMQAYLGPASIEFVKHFPWIGLSEKGPSPTSSAKFDMVDRYASIPDAMPALAILSLFGIVFAIRGRPNWRRRILPVMAAPLVAGCSIFTVGATSYRYVHDFYPFLIVSATLGMGAVQSLPRPVWRGTIKALIVAAGIWSIAANAAFTLQWQREGFWPDTAAKAEFLSMRRRVDSLLPFRKSEPIRYKIGDPLEFARTGQLLIAADPPATYRYDGRRWNYVAGTPLHRFRLLVEFPAGQRDQRMPVWFAGALGSSDAVYVIYLSPSSIQFCSDHWGSGGHCGSPLEIEPGREYRLLIDADRLNSQLTVTLDGRQALATPLEFHAWNDRDVLFGKTLAPAAHGADFTGEIRRDDAPK